jgi:UDP-2,3-diacylglucosamine pyrophosphatase LpxH
MRIYCASDFHIGYKYSNYTKMKEFFELVIRDADELVLCGDVFDLWRCPIEVIKNQEPMKSTYEALITMAEEVPTTIIWGNHDYNLWKKVKIPARITDSFVSNNIYYCHGWRFDLRQRFGHLLYSRLVDQSPQLYQRLFKTPFELKTNEGEFSLHSKKTHAKAREFIEEQEIDYLIMGHTHDPVGNDDKLFDCGDMIDSLSYVIIENGKPRLERYPIIINESS